MQGQLLRFKRNGEVASCAIKVKSKENDSGPNDTTIHTASQWMDLVFSFQGKRLVILQMNQIQMSRQTQSTPTINITFPAIPSPVQNSCYLAQCMIPTVYSCQNVGWSGGGGGGGCWLLRTIYLQKLVPNTFSVLHKLTVKVISLSEQGNVGLSFSWKRDAILPFSLPEQRLHVNISLCHCSLVWK